MVQAKIQTSQVGVNLLALQGSDVQLETVVPRVQRPLPIRVFDPVKSFRVGIGVIIVAGLEVARLAKRFERVIEHFILAPFLQFRRLFAEQVK